MWVLKKSRFGCFCQYCFKMVRFVTKFNRFGTNFALFGANFVRYGTKNNNLIFMITLLVP
jgi:hypothetical protein